MNAQDFNAMLGAAKTKDFQRVDEMLEQASPTDLSRAEFADWGSFKGVRIFEALLEYVCKASPSNRAKIAATRFLHRIDEVDVEKLLSLISQASLIPEMQPLLREVCFDWKQQSWVTAEILENLAPVLAGTGENNFLYALAAGSVAHFWKTPSIGALKWMRKYPECALEKRQPYLNPLQAAVAQRNYAAVAVIAALFPGTIRDMSKRQLLRFPEVEVLHEVVEKDLPAIEVFSPETLRKLVLWPHKHGWPFAWLGLEEEAAKQKLRASEATSLEWAPDGEQRQMRSHNGIRYTMGHHVISVTVKKKSSPIAIRIGKSGLLLITEAGRENHQTRSLRKHLQTLQNIDLMSDETFECPPVGRVLTNELDWVQYAVEYASVMWMDYSLNPDWKRLKWLLNHLEEGSLKNLALNIIGERAVQFERKQLLCFPTDPYTSPNDVYFTEVLRDHLLPAGYKPQPQTFEFLL